jgi:hypothetical protein
MSMSSIDNILDSTSEHIESYRIAISKNPEEISSDEINNLGEIIKSSHQEIHRSIKGKLKPDLSSKSMKRILQAINFLQNDPSAQTKVAALETSLFYETLRDFQKLLETLQVKRGKRVEKVDLDVL